MNACHILVRKLQQFDFNTVHHGNDNTYKLYKDNIKIILGPINSKVKRTYLLILME